MSPKLKPLILPQLVEERRRKLEVQQNGPDGELSYVFFTDNASSSDINSPVTPTFSQRHLRYSSSSSSSLELMPPSSACSESPASPTQAVHSSKSSKRQLPDVQEEPIERDDEESTILPEHLGLYNCLCDEPCEHGDVDIVHNDTQHPFMYDFDYDLGFLSDSDFNTSPRFSKKRRGPSDSAFSGLSSRFGQRLPTLSRWRSSQRRANFTFAPASEMALPLESRLSFSRAPSSRSSSVSAPGRQVPDRTNEPPLPPTPALSFYGSTENVAVLAPLDIEQANAGKSLERDRALATTPLLPPLLTDQPPSRPQSVQQSPLESPTIAPLSVVSDGPLPTIYPSPSLSTKPSVSSFRRIPGGSLSAPPTACPSEIPSPIPNFNLLEQNDAWSDRLGHANYTIIPKPYNPDTATMESLRLLRSDWDQARINFTKHLVRTGEHYGATSNTYALTEAKWAETDQDWRKAEDAIVERIVASTNADEITAQELRRPQASGPSAVPRILDAEKFPQMGDEDIVGPMVRDAVMVRDGFEEKHGASKFWKSLVGKVGLRK